MLRGKKTVYTTKDTKSTKIRLQKIPIPFASAPAYGQPLNFSMDRLHMILQVGLDEGTLFRVPLGREGGKSIVQAEKLLC